MSNSCCWFKLRSVFSTFKEEGADMLSSVYNFRWEERCGIRMSPLIEWEEDAWLYWWVILLLWWEVGAIYRTECSSWNVSLRALWNIFSTYSERRGRAYKTGAHWVFLKISISLFWAQLQHLELIKLRRKKKQTPPPIRNRKGIKKKISPVSFHRHPPATTSYFTMI